MTATGDATTALSAEEIVSFARWAKQSNSSSQR
jgi:hypothetical protein